MSETLQSVQAPDQGLPAPDTVVFLDLSIEQAQKRGGFGEERYEKIELQREASSSAIFPTFPTAQSELMGR